MLDYTLVTSVIMIIYILCSLLTSDFACAAVLISFGAVLGKLSPLQLIIMSLFEIAVYSVNEKIGISVFEVDGLT